MGFVLGVWMLVLGVLGAANLIIARKPEARGLIAKIAPYQGWIGAVSALSGVWWTISAVLNLPLLAWAPVYWITFLATALMMLSLGLLLGVGVLKTFIKHPTFVDKVDQIIVKLVPFQATLGLIAIGLGVWMILSSILFFPRH